MAIVDYGMSNEFTDMIKSMTERFPLPESPPPDSCSDILTFWVRLCGPGKARELAPPAWHPLIDAEEERWAWAVVESWNG